MSKASGTVKSKKQREQVPQGIMFVNATFNNTIITFTNPQGHPVSWSTAGACGFKGARKSTPFAAQKAVDDAGKKAKELGMHSIDVIIRGPGGGRESSIRAAYALGFSILSITDDTPVAFNGCREKGRRRS